MPENKQTDMTGEIVKAAGPAIDTLITEKIEGLEEIIFDRVQASIQSASVKGTFAGVRSTEPDGWKGVGDITKAVYLQATNRFTDPRLATKATGMNTMLPSEGGHAVPANISSELLQSMYQDPNNLIGKCRRLDNVKGSIRLIFAQEDDRSGGLVHGGVKVYRVKEGQQLTSSQPAMESVEMALKPMHGLVYMTEELLDQSEEALEQFVTESVMEAYAYAHNKEIMRGTGTGGEFLGVLNSPALITINAEAGQTDEADVIVSENIANMVVRLRAQARRNAEWYGIEDAERWLRMMTIGVGTGGAPVFQGPRGLADPIFGTLDGRPINYSEHCSALGDIGDLLFADLSQYMVITGGPVQAATSIHLRFDYAETAMRFTMYSAGRPIPSTVYKPTRGSNKSFAVAIKKRS